MSLEKLQIPQNRDGWVMRYARKAFPEGVLHSHRELELNLVVQGTGEYLIQGGRYRIGSGNLLWLFPCQAHLLVEASDDFEMWVLVFRPRLVRRLAGSRQELVTDLGRTAMQTVQAVRLGERQHRELDRAYQFLDNMEECEDDWFNSALGHYFRLSWECGLGSKTLLPDARVHPAVEKVLHVLRDAPDGQPLPSIAKTAGISYSRLCALFLQQTGETLGQYRQKMRTEKLTQLIRLHPDRTLLDLALQAGFGSYAQCHRSLLKFTGLSPRQLRSHTLSG